MLTCVVAKNMASAPLACFSPCLYLPACPPVCLPAVLFPPHALHSSPSLAPVQAFFQRNSRWTPLQDEAKQREVEEEYTQRLEVNHVAAWAPDPWGSTAAALMSRSRHAHRPFNTVRQVLLDTPTAAPRCYRLLARLMDYSPRDPAEMCHQAAHCGMPGGHTLVHVGVVKQ